LTLAVAPVQAQTDIALATLKVELWPEYDQPSMLVILEGVLRSDVPLPATLTINIPARAGAPTAIATMDTTGRLLTIQPTTAPAGDKIAVTLTTDYSTFRVEYYDPALSFNASARDFTFQWTTNYAVDAVAIRAQAPVGASGLAFTPALVATGPADFGLNYYTGSFGALQAGQALTLKMNYTKADSRLSAESVGSGTSAPAGNTAPQATTQSAAVSPVSLPLVLSLAGGALLVGGGAYYWFTRNQPRVASRSKSKKHSHKPRARENGNQPRASAPSKIINAPAQFCTQCGGQVSVGDAFCRNCGAKVRETA
jgi:hypothetical protein